MLHQYVTFELAGQLFGLDVEHVQEVLRYDEYTRVPASPPEVGGLFNLRGDVIPALDLGVRLGEEPRRLDGTPVMNLIVHDRGERLSLLVDRIGDVLELDDDTLEVAPPTLSEAQRALITGVFELERGLLLVLDAQRAAQVDVVAGQS